MTANVGNKNGSFNGGKNTGFFNGNGNGNGELLYYCTGRVN